VSRESAGRVYWEISPHVAAKDVGPTHHIRSAQVALKRMGMERETSIQTYFPLNSFRNDPNFLLFPFTDFVVRASTALFR